MKLIVMLFSILLPSLCFAKSIDIDDINVEIANLLMHMGRGDYLNVDTGNLLMHMGRGDYLNVDTGELIIGLD